MACNYCTTDKDCQCAFPNGVFTRNNYNCRTMSILRDIAQKYHDDLGSGSIGYVPFVDIEVETNQGTWWGSGFIVMTWYKDYPETGNAIVMCDDKPLQELTLELAHNVIMQYEKNAEKISDTAIDILDIFEENGIKIKKEEEIDLISLIENTDLDILREQLEKYGVKFVDNERWKVEVKPNVLKEEIKKEMIRFLDDLLENFEKQGIEFADIEDFVKRQKKKITEDWVS